MKKIDLLEMTRKLFADYRPDEAYTADEVCAQFQRWRAKAFRYKRGEAFVRAGAPATEFATVVSGALQVRMPSQIGEDILMRVVNPGEYVGASLIYSREKKYPYDIVAASTTDIVSFNVDEVRKWRTDPKSQPLFDYLGLIMGKIIRDMELRVMILSGGDIAERLRRYLSYRMERDGSRTIAISGTTLDLAKYLGVNRCALSRVIGHLRDEGKIAFRRNVFTVL